MSLYPTKAWGCVFLCGLAVDAILAGVFTFALWLS